MAGPKTRPPPAEPVPARVYPPRPSWAVKKYNLGYPHQFNVRQLVEDMVWHLPPFQREVVWTPEQQVAFCNSVFTGMPTATILAWRRYMGEGEEEKVLLLDGQQRLTALGATVIRPDGTTNPPPRAYFDLAAGRFTTDPGRWALTMRDIVDLDFERQIEVSEELEKAGDVEGHNLWYSRLFANDVVSMQQLTVYRLEHRATPEFAIEAFRAINRPGVQFDEAEIERLIASAAAMR